MKNFKDILNIEEITPEWFTEILRKNGNLQEGSITSILRTGSQKGTTTNIYFLELEFSNDAKGKLPSAEIVVKILQPDFQYKKEIKPYLKKEVHFYNTIADKMEELPIPTCYYAYFSEEPINNLIILNNLLKTNSLTQLDFTRHYLTHMDKIKRAIDTLAAIHAFWWEHPKLEEITGTPQINKKLVITSYKTLENYLPQFLELASYKISRERKDLYLKCYSLYPEVFWKRFGKKKNLTLIHGDAHPWQFYYPINIDNKQSKAYLSDWSCWELSVGTYDLAYLIGMFSKPEEHRKNQRELIEHYHNALVN
ncbi:MAG: hypothetical protein ACXAAI_07250, partial [Promethearchaeota archaeon]